MLLSNCVYMQIIDVKNALSEKRQSLPTSAIKSSEPDDRLQDAMLVAIWGEVDI